MKKIILPTEFNEKSEKALSGAILIANKMKLKIEVLHIIDTFNYGVNFIMNETNPIILPTEVLDNRKDIAINNFNQLLVNVKDKFDILPEITLEVKTGFVLEIIAESTSNKDTFMVVLSDKSKADYNYRDISSQNSKIISHSECPVCIVPNTAPFKEFQKIIYVTNFQEQDIQNITNLTHLASSFDAEIYVVHISSNPEFEEQIKVAGLNNLIESEVAYNKIKYKTIKNDNFLLAIDSFANEIKADAIAIMRENKTIFKALFETNTSKSIIYKTNLPVIVYQELNK